MNIRAIVVSALMLLLAFAAQAGEKFYKWKDESGAWHYTRTPPPAGAQAENVEVKSAVPATGAATPAASTSPSAAPAAPATADAGAAAPGDVSVDSRADRTAQCEKARRYADTLGNNTYVARDTDGDGEAEIMSADEKARETERAQMAVKLACE
jgi:hypothetical protein